MEGCIAALILLAVGYLVYRAVIDDDRRGKRRRSRERRRPVLFGEVGQWVRENNCGPIEPGL